MHSMPETNITNGLGAQPPASTSLHGDVSSGSSSDDNDLVVFNSGGEPSPQQAGYTLLGDGGFDRTVSDDDNNNEDDGDGGLDEPSNTLPHFDLDVELRRTLNSDAEHLGGGYPMKEEKDIPDESSPALLWNSPPKPGDREINIPEETVAEIKACLSGFQLPDTNMPVWAKQVPEEVWKQQLLDRIHSKTK